jgi:hypothetical protein
MSDTTTTTSVRYPYLLVCQTCGRALELPDRGFKTPSGWLRCQCKGSTFSLRMRDVREALLKEPHP